MTNRIAVLCALPLVLAPGLALADNDDPCASGGLSALSNRPGLGRAISVDGSPCAVPAGNVVLESGFRTQITTSGGTSVLSTMLEPVLRFGMSGDNEIVLSPSLIYSRRTGANLGPPFSPASGMQDAGIGFKHTLRDRLWIQDAVEAFVTVPTGYPTGSLGFSAGVPTYLVAYSAAISLSSRVGLTTTQNVSSSTAPNPGGAMQRYLSYQPSLGLSYAVSSRTAVLVAQQLTLPTAPGGTTGNRALAAIQYLAGPSVLLDAEFEQNLLPAPGFNQHAFGTGVTLRL